MTPTLWRNGRSNPSRQLGASLRWAEGREAGGCDQHGCCCVGITSARQQQKQGTGDGGRGSRQTVHMWAADISPTLRDHPLLCIRNVTCWLFSSLFTRTRLFSPKAGGKLSVYGGRTSTRIRKHFCSSSYHQNKNYKRVFSVQSVFLNCPSEAWV